MLSRFFHGTLQLSHYIEALQVKGKIITKSLLNNLLKDSCLGLFFFSPQPVGFSEFLNGT